VAIFPEGTTGDGDRLLPFHANLLQAAIATDTPVQPVALRYADATRANSPAARWVGDTTLAQSLWQLACGQDLTVHLTILGAQASGHADRRSLATHLRECIAQALEPVLGADPR
jgi:1-acyl-sn-glycerol-3-phosphate acyltransferase